MIVLYMSVRHERVHELKAQNCIQGDGKEVAESSPFPKCLQRLALMNDNWANTLSPCRGLNHAAKPRELRFSKTAT